ncbi:MAG TPA: rhomboid family intramembrane serine protease [Kofleriaceae bacterium]|nr:rhomboid family intramembrane serine protease [Kofleriaceae bacterium]
MLYELLLLSVVVACGYWGWFFVRRQPSGTPMFGIMQLAAAALAGLGLLGRRSVESDLLGLAGAIGLGAGVCLLVVGPLVRWVARRLAAAERLGAAGRLLDLAEILAPGSGVAEEKAVLGAMREIRDGRIEQTVDALMAAKERAPAEARLAIDERIALLYLAAYRWKEAIAHAETHLFGAVPEEPAAAAAIDAGAGDGAGDAAAPEDDAGAGQLLAPPGSLRRALGVAPPVWVELLGAYGRIGDMDRAARMLAKLEDVCAGREEAAMWIHRARVMFLALAGRTRSVKVLVEPRRARHMSAAARTYWVAVAHEHEGDREAATAAYARARARTRGRPRELIDEALARLGRAPAPRAATDAAPDAAPTGEVAGAARLSPVASEVVARVEAAPLPAPVRIQRPRRAWAAVTLTGSLLAVAGLIAVAVGPSSDFGVLVRAGAMVRSLVESGEWWRLVSCVFVHVGTIHLLFNAVGSYFLGRITEELFGGARTVALFGASGIAGACASYLAAPAGVSAGASGAVLGLLGAVFIELTLNRERYRAAWKRGLWGGIVVVTLSQVGIGFFYPIMDQWAHGAGLVTGVVLGAALSPHTRWGALARHAGRALALVFTALAITAAVLVARTSIADSYGDLPRKRHVVNKVAVTAPATWIAAGWLADPDGLVELHAAIVDPSEKIEGWIKQASQYQLERGAKRIVPAEHRILELPAGWEGGELTAWFEDPMEAEQRFVIIVAWRLFGSQRVLASIALPESMARAAPGLLADMLASMGPI